MVDMVWQNLPVISFCMMDKAIMFENEFDWKKKHQDHSKPEIEPGSEK